MNIYYIITGIENALPFTAKFTFTELVNNKGSMKDTEVFYSLVELHEKDIEEMQMYNTPLLVSINRDDENSLALIQRVSKERYESVKTR